MRLKIISVILFLCLSRQAIAAPAAALGYTPKYPPGFSHFDYVNPDAPKGGELVLSGAGNFDSLNPYLLKGISASGLGSMVFETLMETAMDEPFSAYGLIAEDVELAADKLSATFKINPKARFSDGGEVTAEDVKFSFDTLKSKQAHPHYRIYWANIKSSTVLDKYTVRFDFGQVNAETYLLAAQVPVFSARWLKDGDFTQTDKTPPIATGPYTVEKVDLGKTITYKRNPDYWAKDLGVRRGMFNFERVTYKYYTDRTIALEAFKAGEFDYMDIYNSKKWARDMNGPGFDSGEIIKTTLSHKNNAGMQGFVFNLRREIFQDRRVRYAINLAYDFDWANRNLFYDQYVRCDSYFSNSELASSGIPQGEELALLEPFRDKLPAELFTRPWQPVRTGQAGSLRKNLRQAQKLLQEAGWKIQDGVLQDSSGRKLEFEIMLAQKGFERILAPFARNLGKLGITATYRTVDSALYQRRLNKFDYDMVVASYSQSQSPGNEQRNNWHSVSFAEEGSNNLIGLKDPVIDALTEHLIDATEDRKKLVIAARALDRVLLWGEYLVPNWYIDYHRVLYRDKFGRPEKEPLYYPAGVSWVVTAWWSKAHAAK